MTELSESARNKRRIKFIVNNGIIAALYVVLTLPLRRLRTVLCRSDWLSL